MNLIFALAESYVIQCTAGNLTRAIGGKLLPQILKCYFYLKDFFKSYGDAS